MKKRSTGLNHPQENLPVDRRTFLKVGAGAALAAALPSWLRADEAATKTAPGPTAATAATEPATQPYKGDAKKLIWGSLLHLSRNLWCDWDNPKLRGDVINYSPDFRFDEKLWDELLPAMAEAGVNLLVLDLGDAVKYESHPEIAIKNAWTTQRLKTELARLRKLGIEPIPKLNFSTTHDAWLGPYRHMVSSDKYYAVVRELVAEVCSLFERPRFFHIGMDEEFAGIQVETENQYILVRQGELWWHDFLALAGEVQKHGARAWMWADIFESHPDEFLKRMPKSVVQSKWYYGSDFSEKKGMAPVYRAIAQKGYDEIPSGGTYFGDQKSFGRTVEYCSTALPPERLLGFLQTTWKPTQTRFRSYHLQAIAQVKAARDKLIASQSKRP
jgi:hypothetical protein